MRNFLRLIIIFIFSISFTACEKDGGGNPSRPEESPAHIYLAGGFSGVRQIDYAIDDQLNLQVTKVLRIELNPQILGASEQDLQKYSTNCEHDPDEPCGRPVLKPLRSGLYLVRFALIRNSFEAAPDAYQLMTAGETIAEVATGTLVIDVPLRVKDLRLMGSRNQLLIELSMVNESLVEKAGSHSFVPRRGLKYADVVDKSSKLKNEVFETTVDPTAPARLLFARFEMSKLDQAMRTQIKAYQPWLGELATAKQEYRFSTLADLVPMAEIFDQLEAVKERKIKDNYVFTQNLIEVSQEAPAGEGIKRQDLIGAMQARKVDLALYNSLCNLWGAKILPDLLRERDPAGHVVSYPLAFNMSCNRSREHGLDEYSFFRRWGTRYQPFFVFQDVYWVDAAKFKRLQPPGRNFTIQIGQRFYVRSRIEDNFEAGLRPLSWLPLVGPYLSLAGSLAIDVSLKEDTGNELRFTTNMNLSVEENTMAVDFLKYRHCLIVRMNPEKVDDQQIQPYIQAVKGSLPRDQMRRALQERGLFVCGEQESRALTKLEKYYYIYLAKESGYQQDPTDIRNREMTLPLRGERDFLTFLQAGKSTFGQPDSTGADFAMTSWLGGVEKAIFAVSPAAAGIYVDGVFY